MSRAPQFENSVPDCEQPLDKDGVVEEMAIPDMEVQAEREEPVVTRKVGALLTS